MVFLASCEPSQPCDSATFLQCSNGNIWWGGCASGMAAQCARGCVEGQWYAVTQCPQAFCREYQPKSAGEPCQEAADCQPTVATVSTTAVENTYLTCDTVSQTCVTAEAPVVADWLAPCDPAVVPLGFGVGGYSYAYDRVVADSSCAGGLCVLHHEERAPCVANGCTRPCTGDHDCPRGSTCQGADPAMCSYAASPAYCKPGGPAAIGFTCS